MECKDNQYSELMQLRKEVREHEKRIAEMEKNHSVQEYQYKTIMETLTEMKRDIIDLKVTYTEAEKDVLAAWGISK